VGFGFCLFPFSCFVRFRWNNSHFQVLINFVKFCMFVRLVWIRKKNLGIHDRSLVGEEAILILS
jgi:hypothetical protein